MDNFTLVIIALLFGILIGWFLALNRKQESTTDRQILERKLEISDAEIKRLQTQLTESENKVKLANQKKDHLEDIDGIGPVFARRLNEAGVFTFSDLAGQSPDRIKEIISPKNWQEINPELWIDQARQT